MQDTIIDLIRHGEPEGGRAYRGHSIDDPLSEKGWDQMWTAVGDQCPWDTIISSPLTRCLSFARALADENNLHVQIEHDFREVGFGSWEGKTPDQLIQDKPLEYENFYKDPVNNRPAGAESLEDFCARVNTAFQKTLSENKPKHVLIVAHAGVIRAILAQTLNAPVAAMYKIKVANAGLSRIRFDKHSASLEFVNAGL